MTDTSPERVAEKVRWLRSRLYVLPDTCDLIEALAAERDALAEDRRKLRQSLFEIERHAGAPSNIQFMARAALNETGATE